MRQTGGRRRAGRSAAYPLAVPRTPWGVMGSHLFPLHRSPGVLAAVQAQVALESVGPRGKEMIAQFLEPLSTGLFSEVS